MSITGETLRSARLRLGESQAAFGLRLGVDQSAVSRWETLGPPSRGTAGKAIEKILAELGELQPEVRA